ncbi:MAG: hypothetical protein A3C88_02725 [Candidatus Yanofskybacteria bacterium RIFCSPHIGHO2_02_FULL_50_12]|uniref:PilZ domain-containing protein n=1 Tax=Candidatus Yanofskybacteria bacterium RIFCSPHIGHO2_02_FULL_50_12 TaxID=1802685 RepID=A0A1F8FU58_9BACT|nr:MAG: hypothetical protein A3C88_02725 [Candidatus Yanofskybacteria bacterium RIFCSPHIGHO2_02_FULL_50_12]
MRRYKSYEEMQSDLTAEHRLRDASREDLNKHVEILITVPSHVDGHRVIGEIKEITRAGIQLNWAAQCTSPVGPVGSRSRFRRVAVTEIPFNLIENLPGSCGEGQICYLLLDRRILSLHKPYACFISPDQIEGLQPDEHDRMMQRYRAHQAHRI